MRLLLACIAFAASLPAAPQDLIRFPAKGQVPAGYPGRYASTIAAAEAEGRLVIHSTTDIGVAAPLVEDFQALYPRVEVVYRDMNSNDLHNGYLTDLQASPTSADILWSSAMDSLVRLAAAGDAQSYESPEVAMLPRWASWNGAVFGTTFEPVVLVYNKRLVAPDLVPRTHTALTLLLTGKRDLFVGKVVTYDVERSALGFLLAAQDERNAPDAMALVKALGSANARLAPTTEAMLKSVARGDALLGYNALGSYAAIAARDDPSLGYVYPNDYTLVVARAMLIGRKAANPNAARLWVDYLLSRRGQSVLARRAGLLPVRGDVDAPPAAEAPTPASLRPIPLQPQELAAYADAAKRHEFVRRWRQAIGAKP